MKLYSLASSSSANCYLYEFDDLKILLDVGLSRRKIVSKLKDVGISINDIDALLITHEHTDHIKGLETISKKEDFHIYISKGTVESLKYDIENERNIKVGDIISFNSKLQIEVLPMSHDAKEPVGFIFYYQGKKYAHILDTGYIPVKTKMKIKNSDFFVMESNYDEEALITNNKYPYPIKKRILSDRGHLSNIQCNEYLKELCGENTKQICYGHLSPHNNTADLVYILNTEFESINQIVLEKDKLVVVECK